MSASRQQSARVKSGQPSIKSRPVSQGSSLNTEVIEKELEVLSAKQTQNMEATTEEPEHRYKFWRLYLYISTYMHHMYTVIEYIHY